MDEHFFLMSSDRSTRLKSFSGTFSGTKGTIRIQLEIDNPGENLGYLLRQLEKFEAAQKAAIKAAQKAKPRPARKKISQQQKPLALPPPGDGEPV